jgi:acetate CoA/acetoacetate CoA-transferase alpha subunit
MQGAVGQDFFRTPDGLNHDTSLWSSGRAPAPDWTSFLQHQQAAPRTDGFLRQGKLLTERISSPSGLGCVDLNQRGEHRLAERCACERNGWAMRTVTVEEAVADIPDGASIMIGGFMGVGSPERLIDELVRQRKSNLLVIGNDAGTPGKGIGKLVDAALVTRMIASHIGLNPKAQQQMIAGKMAIDLVPQGTLVERIRAGGFGLGGILTPTGVGTTVEKDKQKIEVDGRTYLLETGLRADFALVHSFLADYLGNLQYALTARNFNPVMAMAANTVIVSAEHIVPVGVIAPDHVVTPGPLVDYLVANG